MRALGLGRPGTGDELMETLDQSSAIEAALDCIRRAIEAAYVLILLTDFWPHPAPGWGNRQKPFRPEWGEDQIINIDEDF
jgi:hypothetical protein